MHPATEKGFSENLVHADDFIEWRVNVRLDVRGQGVEESVVRPRPAAQGVIKYTAGKSHTTSHEMH
jgi:hypothetical protein